MRGPAVVAVVFATLSVHAFLAFDSPQAQDMSDCRAVPDNGRIRRSGHYCLTEDLVTDRAIGIEIRADDVAIDLGGHEIRARADAHGSVGIFASNRTNIAIGNGSLAGWFESVNLSKVDGLTVENLIVHDILYVGLRIEESRDVVIRGNVLRGFRYDREIEAVPYLIGINVSAQNCAIVGNDISNAPPGTAGAAIETVHILLPAESSTNCYLGTNHLWSEEPTGKGYGVWVGLENRATIVENRLENQQYALAIDVDAEVVVADNRFEMAPGDPKSHGLEDTFAIYAPNARTLLLNNEVRNYSYPLVAGAHTHDAGTIIR